MKNINPTLTPPTANSTASGFPGPPVMKARQEGGVISGTIAWIRNAEGFGRKVAVCAAAFFASVVLLLIPIAGWYVFCKGVFELVRQNEEARCINIYNKIFSKFVYSIEKIAFAEAVANLSQDMKKAFIVNLKTAIEDAKSGPENDDEFIIWSFEKNQTVTLECLQKATTEVKAESKASTDKANTSWSSWFGFGKPKTVVFPQGTQA